jgi:hypothetical protein
MSTVTEALDLSNPNDIADLLRQIGVGAIMAGMIPRLIDRTGLASSATHVEPEPGAILSVDLAGTTVTIMSPNDTAAAGEVEVTYDADGVATLVFGDGAQTAYSVVKSVMPAGIGATLAADWGGAV